MYKLRPMRDRGGNIVKHDLQSKELPNTRIEPDRRWFGEQIHLLLCLFF
jgi:nuclear GTP-binding protein